MDEFVVYCCRFPFHGSTPKRSLEQLVVSWTHVPGLQAPLLGPGANTIPLVKALNKLQALGYEYCQPPHGIAPNRNEKYFRMRVPRTFALDNVDKM